MSYLVVARHGESRWNVSNKFTGWVDVPLSAKGVDEAHEAAHKLKDIRFDIAFTSELKRAQETLLIILSEQNRTGIFLHRRSKNKWMRYSNDVKNGEIPIHHDMLLNERYYGVLQGMDKNEARNKFGEEKVLLWRRSYRIAPPGGESLSDVSKRVIPYFDKYVKTFLSKGQNILLVTHGNTLRALIKHIDKISENDIPHLNLDFAHPIKYQFYKGKLKMVADKYSFDRPLYWFGGKKK